MMMAVSCPGSRPLRLPYWLPGHHHCNLELDLEYYQTPDLDHCLERDQTLILQCGLDLMQLVNRSSSRVLFCLKSDRPLFLLSKD